MKKLLLTSVFGLLLLMPISSYAGVNAFGVQLPIERHEVSDQLTGGYVAKDFGDTFHIQVLNKITNSAVSDDDKEKYYVFGVDINSINQI